MPQDPKSYYQFNPIASRSTNRLPSNFFNPDTRKALTFLNIAMNNTVQRDNTIAPLIRKKTEEEEYLEAKEKQSDMYWVKKGETPPGLDRPEDDPIIPMLAGMLGKGIQGGARLAYNSMQVPVKAFPTYISNAEENYDLLKNLVFKRGNVRPESFESLNFTGREGSHLAGYYATPHESKAKAYLADINKPSKRINESGLLRNIPDYVDHLEPFGYMSSFKLNPAYIPHIKKADNFKEPWSMTRERIKQYLDEGIAGIYNYDEAFTSARGRNNPLDEIVIFNPDAILKNSWKNEFVYKKKAGY